MSFRVFLTSRATQQLAQSALWWAQNRDVDQADRWLRGFEAAIAGLSESPEQHSLARESTLYKLEHPARQLLYGLGSKSTHRAVFEVRGDTVFVVSIRHLAQDDLLLDELR